MTGQMIALDGGQHLGWLLPDQDDELAAELIRAARPERQPAIPMARGARKQSVDFGERERGQQSPWVCRASRFHGGETLLEQGGGHRSPEIVALELVAATRAQVFGLFEGLHALGGHGEAQPVREADHRADDGGIAAIGRDLGHERPIDLDLA